MSGELDNSVLEGKSVKELELNRKFLNAAADAGLKAFVTDKRIEQILTNSMPLNTSVTELLDSVIADYSGHSALAGYFLGDEPPPTGHIFRYFRRSSPTSAATIPGILPH